MFLLIASYSKSVDEVAPYVAEHGVWVKKYINEKTFLFAGPKKSKLGGVVLTKPMAKAELQKILAEDVYVKADVCDYTIIDFDCKLTIPQLEFLLNIEAGCMTN